MLGLLYKNLYDGFVRWVSTLPLPELMVSTKHFELIEKLVIYTIVSVISSCGYLTVGMVRKHAFLLGEGK